MKLAKAGVTVPEAVIYYDDTDIIMDEDNEEDWIKTDDLEPNPKVIRKRW